MSVGEELPAGSVVSHHKGPSGRSAWLVLCIGCIGLLGFMLRWIGLDHRSLWYDEGFTWWVATQSPSRIIQIIRADTWPPLFYLAMHYWIALLGDSVWAMRAQPALAATVSMVLGFMLAAKVFPGSVPARIAAAGLVALSAMQIQYAQDLRCYPTATMLLLVALLAITMRLDRKSRWWLPMYVVAGTALVYQHNLMWFYLAWLQVAWLLWPGEQRLVRRVREMVVANVAIVLLFAPWIPAFVAQYRNVSGHFWIAPPSTYHFTKVATLVAGIDTDVLRSAAMDMGVPDAADRIVRWPAFLLVCCAVTACAMLVKGEQRQRVVVVLSLAFGPIVMAYVYSHYRQSIFIERVFVPSSVLAAVALGALLAAGGGRRVVRAIAVLLVGMSVASAVLVHSYTHEDPWRQAMAALQADARPGDRALFVAAEGEIMYWYYARQMKWPAIQTGGIPVDFLSNDPPRVQLSVTDDLAGLQGQMNDPAVKRIVLVEAHAGEVDPDRLATQELRSHWRGREIFRGDPILITAFER